MFNVKTATTKELLAKYNALTGKKATKFSDRAAGERQTQAALDRETMLAKAAEYSAAGKAANAAPKTERPLAELVDKNAAPKSHDEIFARVPQQESTGKLVMNAATGVIAAKPKKVSAPSAAKKAPRKAAEGSRLDQRTVRHHVRVQGTEYRSVSEAFKALSLPMGQHIRFRIELKTSETGRATFKAPDGTAYQFILVS